jgi:PAS domain S-box-containing protein
LKGNPLHPKSTGGRETFCVKEQATDGKFPFRVEVNVLKIMQACQEPSNLDDLFEIVLTHLLDIAHVRQAEILLYNRKNDLVLAAEGNKSIYKGSSRHKIMVQSWMMDSAIRRSTRRVRIPTLFLVTSIALKTSEKLMGFLNIQLDRIQTTNNELFANFNLIGFHLSTKIKEIMLQDEIRELAGELQKFSSENKDNQKRITSLSKELYAICAISTKINQSMDVRKSLRKSIMKLKEMFRASTVLVYLKSSGRGKPKLFTLYGNNKNQKYSPRLLEQIKIIAMRDFFCDQPSMEVRLGPAPYRPKKMDFDHGDFKTMIMAPMRAKRKLIGALILLYETAETFNQDNLRLLCGIGDIMGMAIENMYLYKQSQQKKKTAAFLVQSISKFNEKLNLEKTLRSIAERGAEFISKRCHVYLFTETKIPMIHLKKVKKHGDKFSESETFYNIEPAALKEFYEQMRYHKRPSLISDITHTRKFKRCVRSFFDQEGIRSIVSVPLTLIGKSMGLLLFCSSGGKQPFDHLDLSVSEAIGAAASVAIENSRAYTNSVEMSDFLEKKIMEKTIQIQKIQEKLNIRVENRNDIIFRVNAGNRFIFVNKAMETLTGLDREEMYREDFNIEQFVAPEDCKRVKSCFQIVLKGSLPMIRDLVYRHINKRGKDHLISLIIYPETDSNGIIIGVEGVGRDITEKKRLEAELEKTKDLALLGEFSSAIAHQIRNPLGNILMGTKLLQRSLGFENFDLAGQYPESRNENPSVPTFNKEALADIFKNLSEGIGNLNQVVTKLVEYTKTLKLRCSYQCIQTILEENLAMFQNTIARQSIQVETYFKADLPLLSVDAVLISQVFQNIIHNAIQAMQSGGDLIVSADIYQQKPGYVIISVSDTGGGIAPAEVEKIFHPFYTTKDSGTGLGLALAYRIVEAHNGKIWVCHNPCSHGTVKKKINSDRSFPPENGVTFHIILPLNDHLNRNSQDREIK